MWLFPANSRHLETHVVIWSFLSTNLLVQNSKVHFLHMGTGTTASKGTIEIINYFLRIWLQSGQRWALFGCRRSSSPSQGVGRVWAEFKGHLTVLPLVGVMRGWLCLQSILSSMFQRVICNQAISLYQLFLGGIFSEVSNAYIGRRSPLQWATVSVCVFVLLLYLCSHSLCSNRVSVSLLVF